MTLYIIFLCKFQGEYSEFLNKELWYEQSVFSLAIDPVFYYHSSWAMSKMKLKSQFVEYMAVGLMTVLIDMPYDIIGIKYVHWVWHDTDPNICE